MTTLLTFVALNIGLMLAVMPAHAGARVIGTVLRCFQVKCVEVLPMDVGSHQLTIRPEIVTAALEITGIR